MDLTVEALDDQCDQRGSCKNHQSPVEYCLKLTVRQVHIDQSPRLGPFVVVVSRLNNLKDGVEVLHRKSNVCRIDVLYCMFDRLPPALMSVLWQLRQCVDNMFHTRLPVISSRGSLQSHQQAVCPADTYR